MVLYETIWAQVTSPWTSGCIIPLVSTGPGPCTCDTGTMGNTGAMGNTGSTIVLDNPPWLLSSYDGFWDELIRLFEERKFPNVYLNRTLDDAYDVLAGGNNVDIGNMMYPPFHPIYEMREQEWSDIQLVYWEYHLPTKVPNTNHVQFVVQQVLAAGMEVTLAIRLKNECISMSGGGEQEMINEVKLAQKIVDMFFSGIEIAPPGDTAMWGAVHSLLHYCSVSTLASMRR